MRAFACLKKWRGVFCHCTEQLKFVSDGKQILHHLLEIHGGGDLVGQSPVSLRGAQDARKHGSKEKGNWLFF